MIDEYSYAIIGRDYVADVDAKIQRIEAVKEFGTYLQDKNLNGADTVPDENILILWSQFTEKEIKKNQKKFNLDIDVLLERFLKRIADKIRAEQEKGNLDVKTFFKIYIDDPFTFYNDGSKDFFELFKYEDDNILENQKFEGNKILLSGNAYISNVPEAIWNFYIGAYQPLQKWLKDRKGSSLSEKEILH